MTTEFKIYCGTDTNGRDVDGKALALRLAAEYFPLGHTITEELGRWTTADGTMVTEPTIVITWLSDATDANATATSCAATYKQLGFQEAVLITRREIDAVFV